MCHLSNCSDTGDDCTGLLNKLWGHAADPAVEAKVKTALEKKASGIYKGLAREVHPDRLPKLCATDVVDLAQHVSERERAMSQASA